MSTSQQDILGFQEVAETEGDVQDLTLGQVDRSFLTCCRGVYRYARPTDYPVHLPTDRAIYNFVVQYEAEDTDVPMYHSDRRLLEEALLVNRDSMKGCVFYSYPSFPWGYDRPSTLPGSAFLGFYADRLNHSTWTRHFTSAEWHSTAVGGRTTAVRSSGIFLIPSGSSYSSEGYGVDCFLNSILRFEMPSWYVQLKIRPPSI